VVIGLDLDDHTADTLDEQLRADQLRGDLVRATPEIHC